jgi:hypothetical protein
VGICCIVFKVLFCMDLIVGRWIEVQLASYDIFNTVSVAHLILNMPT